MIRFFLNRCAKNLIYLFFLGAFLACEGPIDLQEELGSTVFPVNGVDYFINTVSNTGGTTANGPLAGTFETTNIGTQGDSGSFSWYVYVSLDMALNLGDVVVASGIETGLGASQSSGSIGFAGTWPGAGGNHYLLVQITSPDEDDAGNNLAASGVISLIPPPDPDYRVLPTSNFNLGPTGSAGAPIPGAASFDIDRVGGSVGIAAISWTAAWSQNLTPGDGDDIVFDSGVIPAFGGASQTVPLTGNWPAAGGLYRAIVIISAADDPIPLNNVAIASSIIVF